MAVRIIISPKPSPLLCAAIPGWEIDYYWSKLSDGEHEQCGWLKDRFGLSWQIVPARIGELLKHPKAMLAMMRMKKLDIAELERAAQP